jgi:spore coat polysaccharide biosynthesis protein SpsF
MKILVIVQARMGSSRLPGKVMRPLAGASLLARMIERLRAARTPFDLVVATTTGLGDAPIRHLCGRLGIACFSGHHTDLLDRHYRAAQSFGADVVVKVPSDCPLIDPAILDRVLAAFLQDPGRYDYLSNLHPASYPDGNDVEVMTGSALATAWRESTRPFEREHTTPFLWERPERFRIGNVAWETGRDLSMSHRFTVDYSEDHAFVAAVFEALWTPLRPVFGLDEVLALLDRRPDIRAINAPLAGVNWYRHHLDELRTVGPGETRFHGVPA